jgi:hypothetical protein
MKTPRPDHHSEMVRRFRESNPDMKEKKGIAREMKQLHPRVTNIDGTFKTIEQWRSTVRHVMQASGEKYRHKNPELSKFFSNGWEKWATENLSGECRPWDDPFIIPSSIKQLNVIADLHSVHLDKQVMTKFLKASTNKEALLINGDLMDSESISRHLKSHNVIEYEKEIELCHQILKGLKEEFTHVYFKEGNHDFWLERYLLCNAREVIRLLGMNLKDLLRIGELGIHHIHNLKYWQYGDLDGVHGHEFPGYGMGKFPASSLVDKWQTFRGRYDVNVMASHCHRNDYAVSKKSKDGKFGQAWVTPAMCRKSAGFNVYAGWDQGWGNLSINNDGSTEVIMTVV